jgi:hypothetical protein
MRCSAVGHYSEKQASTNVSAQRYRIFLIVRCVGAGVPSSALQNRRVEIFDGAHCDFLRDSEVTTTFKTVWVLRGAARRA